MQIETQIFGVLDVDEEQIIDFVDGLLGFEEYRRFALVESEELRPLAWLVAVDDPEIAFPLADARYFVKDYDVAMSEDDREALDLHDGDETATLTMVSLPTDEKPLTANLCGPVVINRMSRLGRQVVLRDERYSHRQPSLAEAGAVAT